MWERIALRKAKYELSSLLMKKILAVFVILDFNTSCCISLSAATPLFEYMTITGEYPYFLILDVVPSRVTTGCLVLQSIARSLKFSIGYDDRAEYCLH